MHTHRFSSDMAGSISSDHIGKKSALWNVQEPGDPYDIRKYSYNHSDQP